MNLSKRIERIAAVVVVKVAVILVKIMVKKKIHIANFSHPNIC